MPRELIITNGDVAAGLLRQAGFGDTVLPWRDILYEGPVPAELALEELSSLRASYLASQGYGTHVDIARDFTERDQLLRAHTDFDIVTLWFEHDLTDMLQLLQLLDFFAGAGRDKSSLRVVHSDRYIALSTPAELQRQAASAKAVGTRRLNASREYWALWRAPDPRRWVDLLHVSPLGLKQLWSSVLMSTVHLPAVGTTLDGIEKHVLAQLPGLTSAELVKSYSDYCHRVAGSYMSDWSFFSILDRLAGGSAPLISGLDGGPFSSKPTPVNRQRYLTSRPELTPLGHKVIAGREDWSRHTRIDRWFGGTHLTNQTLWRYEIHRSHVIEP